MIKFNAKKLAAVALAQSTEQTRPYINCVYFENKTAVATDGVIMTIALDDESEISEAENHMYFISKKAIAAMKNRKSGVVTIDNNRLIVENDQPDTPALHEESISENIGLNNTFPKYRNIIPTVDPVKPTGAVFSEIIMRKICDTAKTLKTLNISAGGISILGEFPRDAHIVRYDNHDVFSVVMPLSGRRAINHADQIPSWFVESK